MATSVFATQWPILLRLLTIWIVYSYFEFNIFNRKFYLQLKNHTAFFNCSYLEDFWCCQNLFSTYEGSWKCCSMMRNWSYINFWFPTTILITVRCNKEWKASFSIEQKSLFYHVYSMHLAVKRAGFPWAPFPTPVTPAALDRLPARHPNGRCG